MDRNTTHRRRAGRLKIQKLRALALEGARLAGCTCVPDINVVHHGRVSHAAVGHDDWCPARDAGTQVLVVTP
jgi:hypothetical protein